MKSKGFTILEVMVALAIFATAALAMTKAAQQYTQATSNAKLRTYAQFVAMNEIALMKINGEWLEGTQSKHVEQQGHQWEINKKAQSTISPKVQRIDMSVKWVDSNSGKAESSITQMVFFNYVNQKP